MRFQIRTFDAASGAVAERTVEGDSPAAVRLFVERDGAAVLSVTPLKSGRGRVRTRGFAKGFDTVLFCEELRTLLSSGMSLVEAVETLCAKGGSESRNVVLLDIRQRLLDGKPLSAALELNRFGFPPLLVASVRASERSSRIEEALDEYISYETVGRELGRKMVSAAIYPGLVIGFGFAVSTFMISYVVPRFAHVYEDIGKSVSLPTMMLLKFGSFTSAHFGWLAAGGAAGIAALGFFYRNGKLKSWSLRLLGRSRLARHYLRLYQLSRVYQTMSMLLKGGYTLSDAIPLAHNLAFDARLRGQIVASHLAIMEGRRLSTAFADHGLTDNVTERLLQVGERSGSLVKVMDIIAQAHRQELTLFMERATRLVEPVLLMAVALMIGAIIVLMYMPVFDLAGGM
jgi:general secretion pathway protein F